MLIKCPECKLQISDKAYYCPHCGYPINPEYKPQQRRSTKRKRLPNGFGQITELHNRNLRKPFRAMITQGFTNEGRPIQKLLKPEAYFETYNDAYEALLKYNKNPYSYSSSMTIEELYYRWYPEYLKTVDSKTAGFIPSAWNRLEPIWSIRLCDFRKYHVKELLNNTQTSPTNIGYMKRLVSLMLDYAVEYELIERNFAKNINLQTAIADKENCHTNTHSNFTNEELNTLWQNINYNDYVKMILIQCYMGWRPSELVTITKDNVNINEFWIQGGMKTENGKNRKVPVHSSIVHLIEYFLNINTNTPYLFNTFIKNEYRGITYTTYKNNFIKTLAELNINPDHKLHDPRVTFVTLCKKYNVNEYAIKYMAGHSIQDLTEQVYTKRDFTWLKSEIEKLKVDV